MRRYPPCRQLLGGGLTDLVTTSGCAVDATIGDSHWRVFPQTCQ